MNISNILNRTNCKFRYRFKYMEGYLIISEKNVVTIIRAYVKVLK